VAGFGTADNEPVAFLEEGGHVALLAASREDFRVMRDVAEWPPLPEGT
jgi:glucokinase